MASKTQKKPPRIPRSPLVVAMMRRHGSTTTQMKDPRGSMRANRNWAWADELEEDSSEE